MRYTAESFRRQVFLCYYAKLLGWSPDIPFQNFSRSGAPSLPDTRELICLIQRGVLRFEEATPDDIRAARRDVANAVPGPARGDRPLEGDRGAGAQDRARPNVT